jgi:hypothetical protein
MAFSINHKQLIGAQITGLSSLPPPRRSRLHAVSSSASRPVNPKPSRSLKAISNSSTNPDSMKAARDKAKTLAIVAAAVAAPGAVLLLSGGGGLGGAGGGFGGGGGGGWGGFGGGEFGKFWSNVFSILPANAKDGDAGRDWDPHGLPVDVIVALNKLSNLKRYFNLIIYLVLLA